MTLPETLGKPISIAHTGRCPSCNARVAWRRGEHKRQMINLMSTNGKASGIRMKLLDGHPEAHVCPDATSA